MFSLLSGILSKGMDISECIHGTLFPRTRIKQRSLPDFCMQGFLSVILAKQLDVNHREVIEREYKPSLACFISVLFIKVVFISWVTVFGEYQVGSASVSVWEYFVMKIAKPPM